MDAVVDLRRLKRRLIISVVGPLLLALLAADATRCVMESTKLRGSASDAAHAALHELRRSGSRDQDIMRKAHEAIQTRLGEISPERIAVRIDGDRRSVAVTIRRAGVGCIGQILGLTATVDPTEIAELSPPPGQRAPSSGGMCLGAIIPVC